MSCKPIPASPKALAGGAKVAMFAVAIAVVLGALFYGLNNTTVNQAGTTPANRTAQTQPANPAAPPGMRDVTPRSNIQPGTTTGAATNRPATTPPASTDMNKSARRQPTTRRPASSNNHHLRNDAQRANRPAAFSCSRAGTYLYAAKFGVYA